MYNKFLEPNKLRRSLLALSLGAWALPARALQAPFVDNGLVAAASTVSKIRLSATQAQAFRQWFTLLVRQQIRLGPSVRWAQRDCAGLVRFAAAQALRTHDAAWLKAYGFWGQKIPQEVSLLAEQQGLGQLWQRVDGTRGTWVGALELVQANTRFIGKDVGAMLPADLLFFDQGDAQHLMVWMGHYLAYHTGNSSAQDNGLRAYRLAQLLEWTDVRWQPRKSNPNFSGVYRLNFL